MEIKELATIVGDVLNIHEDPINNENAMLELSMKELLTIVNKCTYKPRINPFSTFQVNGLSLYLNKTVKKQPQFYNMWGEAFSVSAYRLKDGATFFGGDTVYYKGARYKIKRMGNPTGPNNGITICIGGIKETGDGFPVEINDIDVDENVQNDWLTRNGDQSRTINFKIIDNKNIERNKDGKIFSIGGTVKIENSLGTISEVSIVGFNEECVFIGVSDEFPMAAGINSFL